MTKLVRKILISIVILLGLYSAIGFFLVPYIATRQIQDIVQEKFSVKPKIGKISFNPFSFYAVIENFELPGKNPANEKNRLEFEKFAIQFVIHPLFKKEIRFKTVELKAAHGQFIIYKDGATNWAMKETPEEKKEEKKKAEGKPWTLTLQSLDVNKSSLDFWDHTHPKPLELPLGPLSLKAANISTSLGSQTALKSLSISIGEKGHINLGGQVTMEPLQAQVSLDIAEAPMVFLTAYLSDRTTLSLKDGTTDLKGELKYAKGNLNFEGSSEVHNLSIIDESEKPVVTWQKVSLKDIDFNTKPMQINASEMDVVGLDTKVILHKDGTLNFRAFLKPEKAADSQKVEQNAVAQKAKSKPDSAMASDEMTYKISKLALEKCALDYADEQIRPHFAAHVHNLSGVIGPISNKRNEKINVKLDGQVEAFGKFAGQGYFIPSKQPALDLKMNFHNIEMTTFTPYSGHFAGYEISKGKLFIDFHYTMVNYRIKGDNDILLDQFTLGNKVDSDVAVHLPLKLALALMKDRKGQIKFKLPVEGDAKNPSFSWSNLIWTAVKNLLVKVVTAPFDFIAGLFGGKDLQNIYFQPGSNDPLAGETDKVEKIAKALEERPNLAMEISGQYQDQDVEALQKKEMEAQLAPLMQKYKGDHEKSLRKLADTQLKGENIKDLSVADLEKKLEESYRISENHLKALALSRGNAVMTLLGEKHADTQRIYLLSGRKSEDGKQPQVQLTLKEK